MLKAARRGENTLALYWWDGSQWVREASSAVNNVGNTVTATPNHFSRWAVMGEARRVYLPLVGVAPVTEGELNVIALPRDWCNYGAVIDGFEQHLLAFRSTS